MADLSSAPAESEIQVAEGGGFVRRSSGLVRNFSQFDNWMYNTLAINVVMNGALVFGLMLVTFPRANLPLAFLIAGAFCCFEAIGYALLTAVMPRSGGDYVFQSRIFGGATGMLFGFTLMVIASIFYFGLEGGTLSYVMLAPFFTLLGKAYGAGWMVSLGTWLSTHWGIFVCGVAVTITAALLNARGLKLLRRVQRYTFALGLALLVMFMVVLLVTSRGAFQSHLNGLMASKFHIHNAYQATIKAAGHVQGGYSLNQTLLAGVIAGFSLVYPAWGAQQAGEIRRADSVRSNAFAMLGAEIISVVLFVLISILLQDHVGRGFLYASGAGTSPLPIPAFLGFFFTTAGNATIFVWLSLLMFICWFLIWIANASLAATRGLMAASFDRVLPEWIGQVDQRVHVPLRAIVVIAIVGLPVAALYSFVSSFAAFTFGLYVPVIAAFFVTMLAAAVLPFTNSRLYNGSTAARYKIGPVPLITVCGLVFDVYAGYSLYAVLAKSEFGANGWKGLVVVGAIWALGIGIYVAARLVRRREGIDLSMSYKELPVE